jgi:hypothetical protein
VLSLLIVVVGRADALPAENEQEVGGSPVAGMRQCALLAADAHPCVERVQGGRVERDDPLGVELAQRHLEC